jgi:hypothetical protein
MYQHITTQNKKQKIAANVQTFAKNLIRFVKASGNMAKLRVDNLHLQ